MPHPADLARGTTGAWEGSGGWRASATRRARQAEGPASQYIIEMI